MRYLVETSSGEPSFTMECDKPLEKGLTFTQEGNTYIARSSSPAETISIGHQGRVDGKGDFPRGAGP